MADDEIVAIVDENNRVIGSSTRREMRCKRLIHRATYIFVFNGRGELFVQKRKNFPRVGQRFWLTALVAGARKHLYRTRKKWCKHTA